MIKISYFAYPWHETGSQLIYQYLPYAPILSIHSEKTACSGIPPFCCIFISCCDSRWTAYWSLICIPSLSSLSISSRGSDLTKGPGLEASRSQFWSHWWLWGRRGMEWPWGSRFLPIGLKWCGSFFPMVGKSWTNLRVIRSYCWWGSSLGLACFDSSCPPNFSRGFFRKIDGHRTVSVARLRRRGSSYSGY